MDINCTPNTPYQPTWKAPDPTGNEWWHKEPENFVYWDQYCDTHAECEVFGPSKYKCADTLYRGREYRICLEMDECLYGSRGAKVDCFRTGMIDHDPYRRTDTDTDTDTDNDFDDDEPTPEPEDNTPAPPTATCHRYEAKGGCVNSENIVKYKSKTLKECQQLCSEYGSECVGIEYFKPTFHRTASDTYVRKDCNLSSSVDMRGCDID